MRVLLLFLLSLLSWPALAAPPAAAPSTSAEVRIVDTWPPAEDGYLPRNQSFHVRLAYRSDTPVGIWLRPMYQGQSANAGSNPSARYVGEGEALGWFFLMQPGDKVDEIRVVVGDGSGLSRGDLVAATLPVNLTGSSTPAEATPPEWVTRLKAEAEAAAAEARRQAAQQPMSATESGLTVAIIVQFNSETGIEPASVAPTESAPDRTHSGVGQPGVQGIAPFITASYAMNSLRTRRIKP